MANQRIISVFGSSSPAPGSPDYDRALRLGRLLAEAGYAVATGGYSGTMEAASRGAAEAGGRVIGVTCGRIDGFREGGPNRWIQERVHCDDLEERLLNLVKHNDGMVVLSGGIGTLSEFALAWSLLQVGEITPRPLVAIGSMWDDLLRAYARPEYIDDYHRKLVAVVSTPEAAVSHIAAFHGKQN
jgi:hypothetical protein